MNQTTACDAKIQDSVASELLKLTQQIAERAGSIAERLNGKLAPVMKSQQPSNPCVGEKLSREFPPLFAEWSSYIFALRSSLDSIEDAIRRTEL
jgi:hypothetical protein